MLPSAVNPPGFPGAVEAVMGGAAVGEGRLHWKGMGEMPGARVAALRAPQFGVGPGLVMVGAGHKANSNCSLAGAGIGSKSSTPWLRRLAAISQ